MTSNSLTQVHEIFHKNVYSFTIILYMRVSLNINLFFQKTPSMGKINEKKLNWLHK